jgi:hypothetical protein
MKDSEVTARVSGKYRDQDDDTDLQRCLYFDNVDVDLDKTL